MASPEIQEHVENAEAFIADRVPEAEMLAEAVDSPDILSEYGPEAVEWARVSLAAVNEAITSTRAFIEFASQPDVTLTDVEWQGENLNDELADLFAEYNLAREMASLSAEAYRGGEL